MDSFETRKHCAKCGEEKDITEFYKNKNRSDGLNGFCKPCMKEYKYPQYHKDRYVSPVGKFGHYKSSAKDREIEWNLQYNDFIRFWGVECSYCGANINTIGLDRINNNLGYEKNNVVPCCKICNYAKGILTQLEWNMYRDQLLNYRNDGKLIFVEFNVRVDSLPTQYGNYKRSAKRRGVDFGISLQEFGEFFLVPCAYCGIISNTVGIDRCNNNDGYVLNNLVSCCKICNRAKGNLPTNEWSRWIDDICRRTNEKKK